MSAIHNFSLQFSQILVFHITTDIYYLLTGKSTNDIDTKLKHNSLHIFIPLSFIVFFFLWLTESLITPPGSFWNTPYLTPRHPPFQFHFITNFFLNLTAGTAVAFHKARSDQHFSALPVPLMQQLHITSKCAVLCTCRYFRFQYNSCTLNSSSVYNIYIYRRGVPIATRVYTHSAQAK